MNHSFFVFSSWSVEVRRFVGEVVPVEVGPVGKAVADAELDPFEEQSAESLGQG